MLSSRTGYRHVAAKVGNVTISATSTSAIQATIAAVAASVTFGGDAGVGVALGIGVARNFSAGIPRVPTRSRPIIASEGRGARGLHTGQSKDRARPDGGRGVRIHRPTLNDGDPNVDGQQPIDLSTQSYQDASLWKPVSIKESAAEIQAQSLNSSIQSGGALSLTANANETIDAIVIAAPWRWPAAGRGGRRGRRRCLHREQDPDAGPPPGSSGMVRTQPRRDHRHQCHSWRS